MALRSRKVVLCSRDERTAMLFRGSWKKAYTGLGFEPLILSRWDGAVRYLLGAILARLKRHRIVAFGVAEMLFLIPSFPHVGVITGMGRLADRHNKYRKSVLFLLKMGFGNRTVVVLNNTDLRILRAIGFRHVQLIHGEGYSSKIPPIAPQDAASNDIQLLYVGRLLKSKGVKRLTEQFLMLNKSNARHKITLRLVGDSDFNNSDAVGQIWLNETSVACRGALAIHPFTLDFAQFVTHRTIFVSLSEREGMPFSVLEMLDAGVPCLLSAVPGHQDLKKISRVLLVGQDENLEDLINSGELETLFDEPRPNVSKFEIKSVIDEITQIIENEERLN